MTLRGFGPVIDRRSEVLILGSFPSEASLANLESHGWIECDDTHPKSPTRPDSDRAILQLIAKRLEEFA